MSASSVVKEREGASTTVAKNMFEEIWVCVEEVRAVWTLVVPTSGEESFEECASLGEGRFGGYELTVAYLQEDLIVVGVVGGFHFVCGLWFVLGYGFGGSVEGLGVVLGRM